MTLSLAVPPDTPPDGRGRSGLRILIGADTYPPDVNGAAYFAGRLAGDLAARGHDVHVVCPSDEGRPYAERKGQVAVHRLRSVRCLVHPTFRVAPPLGSRSALDRLVERVAPDVVHVQGHFPVCRGLLRAARRRGTPVVATNHFMPENVLGYVHLPAAARSAAGRLAWRDFVGVISGADHVTTPTPIAARLLRDKGFPLPVEPVSCGIDIDRFRPSEEGHRSRFGLPHRETVLYVGRLDEEKHVEDLVRALPRLREHRDAQAVIVGTGARRGDLERLGRTLGVTEHLHFLGFVHDDDLPLVYAAADVFCMPGTAELQSIATLEAMASSLPVVAADAMALPHLVRPGVNGALYPPGDSCALADHLVAILGSPSRRCAMGAASREIAGEHHHGRSLSRFEEIYAELTGRNLGRDLAEIQRHVSARSRPLGDDLSGRA
ncbi:MAG: glycosyltransferase [Streptosporangiales bacterium]|nr:glycosyltransferase [Streptosporangiales bacterium]